MDALCGSKFWVRRCPGTEGAHRRALRQTRGGGDVMPGGGLVAPSRARSLVAFRTCPVLLSHVGEPGKAKY